MDGIAPGVAVPSTPLWRRHVVRRLHAYSPNRSDKSGTPRAARGRHKTYIRELTASRSIATEKQAFHLPLQILRRSFERFAAGIDDDGPLGIQPIEVKADGLTDAPLDSVAHHGFPEGAGCGEPDMRSIRLRLADAERREEGPGEAGSVVINAPEIFRSKQTYTFGKTGDGILPLGTDGQLLTAPGPAAREYRATVLGLHTGKEAMRFGTVTIIRLKGAFRHFSSSI